MNINEAKNIFNNEIYANQTKKNMLQTKLMCFTLITFGEWIY